ncbi:non-specific lipid transfer protein GPI-anchored 14 [Glycine max]|uniref:non-specific lipid transfer protein GPI-anchored 14 n=1 Tax=Glycine max TaxID=3847 RepID=UPI0007191781|nr:non-specific lipid transfer protein GPI-anchored 14 [Glycine max]|eukprot:XP_014624275.1 protein YLS3 [Glycine max]
MGDSAQDKQRCAESLTGVATCLPYLGADAKAPTADCCSGLTQAMKANKKCVCLILKDRDDPDLGLNINMTIAVGLPSLCKTPDNLSQCSGSNIDDAEVLRYCKKNLASFKVPEKVFITDSLPKTATGKILRRLVAEHIVSQI